MASNRSLPSHATIIGRLHALVFAMILVVTVVGCGNSVEGKYVKISGGTGWKSLEFKSKGILVINDGQYRTTYEIRDGHVIINAGIMKPVAEISGNKLLVNDAVFKKQ